MSATTRGLARSLGASRLLNRPLRLRLLARRPAKIFAALVVALVVAGSALAFLTSTGHGSGSATAGTAQQATISPGTPTTALYPGLSGDVAAVISNPNSAHVKINSLVLDTSQGSGGFAVDAAHAGCTNLPSTLSYTTQNNGGNGWLVPPKVGVTNGSLSLDLTGAISMSTGVASACQGATFTVYLKAGS